MDIQTSGYLVRRKAWQCTLLGESWAAQAVASAHEDQERVHCLWTHWHQHSSPAGECLHHSYPLIYHWFINAVLKNDQSRFLHFKVLLLYFAQSPQAGTKEKTLCCWFCTSGPISLSAKIERKGYTPGKSVTIFTIHLDLTRSLELTRAATNDCFDNQWICWKKCERESHIKL